MRCWKQERGCEKETKNNFHFKLSIMQRFSADEIALLDRKCCRFSKRNEKCRYYDVPFLRAKGRCSGAVMILFESLKVMLTKLYLQKKNKKIKTYSCMVKPISVKIQIGWFYLFLLRTELKITWLITWCSNTQ